ncbi:MAG: hypothetical protein WA902_22470 [Thermosynechococcaceae cyanobacterium]
MMNSCSNLRAGSHPRRHPSGSGQFTVALLTVLCLGLYVASKPSRCAYAQEKADTWHPLVLNLSSEGCTISP